MPPFSARFAYLACSLALVCSPTALAQPGPWSIDAAINAASNHPAYQNQLSQTDLQSLLHAAAQSDQALRSAAGPLIARSRESAVATYVETLGLISAQQSALLEQMLQAGYAETGGASGKIADRGSISTGWWLGAGAVAAVAAAAVGGGGGGGGGGGNSAAPTQPPIEEANPNLPTLPPSGAPDYGPEPGPADPSAKLLTLPPEHLWTNGYNLTFGHVAHERGFSGEGNLIALIDSGLRSSHLELAGQVAGHYNMLTGATSADAGSDSGTHGTHVAGILAARRNNQGIVGYAYGAQLLNVRYTNDSDVITASDRQLANGFAWARTQGARWFNNSWSIDATLAQSSQASISSAYPALLSEWRTGVADQRVYVWATGNGAQDQPLVFAALPSLYPELQPYWLAVASVDSATGVLSAFSNACGDAAPWCLVAPGTDIISSISSGDDHYGRVSGTSMAAPAVTGALAVISQAFPTLSSAQVVQRLLYTANKDGLYADQRLYGQGLLDLELATRPVGSLSVLSTGGQLLPVENSGLTLGAPFGSANPLAGLQVMATDQLSAGFAVDLGQLMTPSAFRHDAQLGFQRLGRRFHSEPRGPHTLSWVSSADGQVNNLLLRFEQRGGSSLALGQLDNMDLLDSYQAQAGLSQLDTRLAAPFWLQQRHEQTLAMRQRLPLGAAAVELTSSANAVRQGLSLGLSTAMGEHYLSTLEVGYLLGRDGLFNSQGRGALDLANASRTLYTGWRGQLRQGSLTLRHAAYLGQSRVDANGLLADMGQVTSSSWLIGGQYAQGDQHWGLTVQQPLRVESASSRINLATGYSGNLFNMQSVTLDLAPDGRQINLEAFWQKPLSPSSDLKLSWLGIRQPGHQAESGPMQVLMGQWQQHF